MAAYMLAEFSGWEPPALAAAVALLSGLAGFGLYVVGTAAHEGFHFTLARSKLRSAAVGIWFSSAVIGFLGVGFHLMHSRHHRYTNEPGDPDLQLFSRFNNIWSRLFLLRLVNNRGYTASALQLLRRNLVPEEAHTVFTLAELRMLAHLNFVAQAFWILIYLGMFLFDPWLGACVVLFPHLMTAIVREGLNRSPIGVR